MSYIQSYRDIHSIDEFNDIDLSEIKDLIYEFIKRIVDDKRSVRSISTEFDNDMSLSKGTGISIFRYLLINKIIRIDLSKKIDLSKPIKILEISQEDIKKVQAI